MPYVQHGYSAQNNYNDNKILNEDLRIHLSIRENFDHRPGTLKITNYYNTPFVTVNNETRKTDT
jgi:hypothetical protein